MLRGEERSFFKWVSLKELIFVFLACSIVAVLLQTQDILEFQPIWNDTLSTAQYMNHKFPVKGEKIPLPIVTDLESDGHSDIIIVTPDRFLKVFSTAPSPAYLGHHGFKHTTRNISLTDSTDRVVALATGFLQRYESMIQVRKQVIVVLYADWTVSCYNHNLKRLWSKVITDKEYIIIGEATALVSPVKIKKSDIDTGTIIVGGRIAPKYQHFEDSYQRRLRRGEKELIEERALKSLGHYSTYALDGKSGYVTWKHEPGDFEVHPAYDEGISSFLHLKLTLHKYINHQGEVSWHQYSGAIRNIMPHSWYDDSDSKLRIAHFKKDRKKTDERPVSEHLSKVGDLAVGHLAGYAFGGLRPHSPSEHVHDPNVLIIHTMKGVEVLHLQTGRPMFTLPLSPTHAVHGDINADGIVEHVLAVVNPGEEYKPGDVITKHDDIECFGQASPLNSGSKPIFRHSICKATHWTESFIATEKWLPKINKAGRKNVNHGTTEPFTPILIESPSHQHPLKLSSLSRNSTFGLPLGVVYDSIFLLSSGRVTSIGPTGQFNWQVDTQSDWDTATDILYNKETGTSVSEHYVFSTESFTPTITTYSLKPYGKKTHILIVGWYMVTVLDARDGTTTARFMISCPPVMKAVVEDFTDDGVNDILLVCSNRIIGFSSSHRSGFWHNTVLSLFIGLMIVIVAVYTRQRTGFLMPKRKEAVD